MKRRTIKIIQELCVKHGLDPGPIDGYWGPQTYNAYTELDDILSGKEIKVWRPEDTNDLVGVNLGLNPNNWPKIYTLAFDEFYGEEGKNLVRVNFPYEMVLSWDESQKVNSTKCHAKVKDSLERILDKVLDFYGINDIKRLNLNKFGGCFNMREIRGGSKPSTHSWAISLDFDPNNNKLKWGKDRASFAKPEYDKWWEIWEDEGWVSLGRARNFDWMHVQAAKI